MLGVFERVCERTSAGWRFAYTLSFQQSVLRQKRSVYSWGRGAHKRRTLAHRRQTVKLEFADVKVTQEQVQTLQDALRRGTYDVPDFGPIVVTPESVKELAQVLREHWANAL